jgi:acyl-coenzyme A synthetase/AMP-(fatty) acid ligase
VTAFVIPKGEFSEAEARKQLKSLITDFKQPKKYVTVNALPRNAMGKIQRARLREEYSTLFDHAGNPN